MSYTNNDTVVVSGVTDLIMSSHFMDSVSASLLLSYIIAISLDKFKTQEMRCVTIDGKPLYHSLLYKMQVFMTLLLCIYSLGRGMLQLSGLLVTNVGLPQVTMNLSLHTFLWPASFVILLWEGRICTHPAKADRSFNLILTLFWISSFVSENLALFSLGNNEWLFSTTQRNVIQNDSLKSSRSSQVELYRHLAQKTEILLPTLKYLLVFGLFISGLNLAFGTSKKDPKEDEKSSSADSTEEKESDVETSPFHNFLGKLNMFVPFIWPSGSPLRQFFLVVCFVLLGIGRCISIIRPLCYKKLVDSLTHIESDKVAEFRWDLVVANVGMEFLDECLSNLRSTLWDQVSEQTIHDMEKRLFRHIHRLSLGWHLSRKTGEVLNVISNGTSSAEALISHLIFNVLPSVVDIGVALVYFVTAFNAGFAIILLITFVTYAALTYWLSQWFTKLNKEPIKLYTVLHAVRVDSLLNFETVKCYNAEDYEVSRYTKCLLDCRNASWKRSIGYDVIHLAQKFVTTIGLLAGSLLCVYIITTKQGMTMGDYVLFIAYTRQVYSPMYMFGRLYSYLQRCFMKMEKMFAMLNEEEDVKDIPNASELVVTEGRVEFKNVSFSYKLERPILKDISFVVYPGQTVAIVGPTGSGKSTIARLLYRLYDVTEGCILIDHQNVVEVTQKSLRCSIGTVPQDTVLFNADIKYNIRYGNLNASDEEVEKAAVAAEIHKAILGFPKGYDTVVGERGLKLSGGEKQRIAIARTMLKAAPITLLDEATSSLDTQTERTIQLSLNRLCASKTTIIIAHRLSTIIHAHQICVLKDGQIIERGTHEDLLKLDGEYNLMWQSQLKDVSEVEALPSGTESKTKYTENIENDARTIGGN